MWDDFEFATSRLKGTIVRKGNVPIVIDDMRNGKIYYRTLGSHREGVVTFAPDCLNITPVELGYLNTEEGARYLTRIPRRRWKQGLDSGGVRFMQGSSLREIRLSHYHPELSRTIKGKYPTIDEAIEKSFRTGYSVAWCRGFAVKCCTDTVMKLYFKGTEIGTLKRNFTVKLKEGKEYLNEYIREELRRCGK